MAWDRDAFENAMIDEMRANGGAVSRGPLAGHPLLILTLDRRQERPGAARDPDLVAGWRRLRGRRHGGRLADDAGLGAQPRGARRRDDRGRKPRRPGEATVIPSGPSVTGCGTSTSRVLPNFADYPEQTGRRDPDDPDHARRGLTRRPTDDGMIGRCATARSRRSSHTRRGCSTSATGSRSTGRRPATRTASPRSRSMAAPAAGAHRAGARWFDPDRYRLVQLDQRGCGRSTPHAGDLATDLSTNTTHHLIADIERLREHLGIERWLVWGASWGVTLALAYAERFPERVTEMVLLSITMTRRADVHWLAHETGRYFPEQWARFRDAVPEGDRDDLVAAYDRLLNHTDDAGVRIRRRTTGWPGRTRSSRWRRGWRRRTRAGPTTGSGSGSPGSSRTTSRTPRGSRRTSSCATRTALAGIPAVLLHGRLDLSGPPDVAWQLAAGLAGVGAPLHRRRPHRRRRDGPPAARGPGPLRRVTRRVPRAR